MHFWERDKNDFFLYMYHRLLKLNIQVDTCDLCHVWASGFHVLGTKEYDHLLLQYQKMQSCIIVNVSLVGAPW
jgi:hypothetical protein